MSIALTENTDLMTMSEVCDQLRCSRYKIYRLMREAGFPYIQVGARRLVRRESLEAWLNAAETNRTDGADLSGADDET